MAVLEFGWGIKMLFYRWGAKSIKAFFLLGILAILAGCLGDKQGTEASESVVSLAALEVVTYDTTKATLRVLGTLNLVPTTDQNVIEFYDVKNCSGIPLGQGLKRDFASSGINAQVSSVSPTSIYLKTNTDTSCYFVANFSPSFGPPATPVLTSTNPASPSQLSYRPLISGSIPGVVEAIRFFDDAACAHSVGTGSKSDFISVGIRVVLQPNAENKIYAQAVEPFGQTSACSEIGTYVHSSSGPEAPVFSTSDPLSPTRLTQSPKIMGTASADTKAVLIYSDAACSIEVGTGTTEDFQGDGITISVAANASTDLYGKSIDDRDRPSSCNFLTTFINDTISPDRPTYISANPISPTRLTMYPRIKGTLPWDATTIRFFDADGCVRQIGEGPKVEFESTGVLARVNQNATMMIYGMAADAAGNVSACTSMAEFTHDSIAPNPPIFNTTFPISPNNKSTTPYVVGNATADTVQVDIYRDEFCTMPVGTGTGLDFAEGGIQITVPDNAITSLYGTAKDAVGNISSCGELTIYAHSTLPAPPPTFMQTVPASPSKVSYSPFVLGNAPNSVSVVRIYLDNTCTNQVASTSRLIFSTMGLQVVMHANSITDIYAISTDVYGNDSPCTFFTTYTHSDIPPLSPSFTNTDPVSPNNSSITPLVNGTVLRNMASVLPPSQIRFYDSFLCISQLGSGVPDVFNSSGLRVTVPPNISTSIYARVFDAAGNVSPCTFMTDYVYVDIAPGKPIFESATPGTPSYTKKTQVKGTLATSANFLNLAGIRIYRNSACTDLITTGSHSDFLGSGIVVIPDDNAITPLYAQSEDIVGNKSSCNLLVNFQHANSGMAGISTRLNVDGSVSLNWLPDNIANPRPKYYVKRSLTSGGPYTILTADQNSTGYLDKAVSSGMTYYYVVAATNITGISKDSEEVSVTVNPSNPVPGASLTATPGLSEISLVWTGFPQDMSYEVYRSLNRGGPYSKLKSNLASTSYLDKSLTNGTTYFYVIRGANPNGKSIQSNEVSAVPMGIPSAPINLTAKAMISTPYCGGAPGVILTWSPSAYYTGFNLKRRRLTVARNSIMRVASNSAVDCNLELHTSDAYSSNVYAVHSEWGGYESGASNTVAIANIPAPSLTVNPGDGHVVVSWNDPYDSLSMAVKRATQPGGPYVVLDAANINGTYTDNAVSNGTAYYYVIEGTYLSGLMGFQSIEVSRTPGLNPSAPSNLIVTVDAANKPFLQWTPSDHFSGFNIYRSSSSGGPFTLAGTSAGASYTDTTPIGGMNYYKVKAFWGSSETASTNTVSFRHGVPGTISVTPSSSNLELTWASVTGALKYNVYRSLSANGPYAVLATPTVTSYTDSSAVAGVGYYYVVSASFSDGTEGRNSAQVSGMRTGSSVPSGVTVTATTGSSVTLAWARVYGGTTYNVYKASSSGGPYSLVKSYSASPATVTGLAGNTTYYFKVSSVVSGNESSQSSFVSALTLTTPAAPNVTPGLGVVSLSWTSVPYSLSYTVERSTDLVTFTPIASGISTVIYQDTSVINGKIYFYRIKAVFGANTLTSPSSWAVTPGNQPLPPGGLTVADNSNGTDVALTWAPASGVTSYKIYMSSSSGGPWGTAIMSVSSASVTLTGLTTGTTYFVSISAVTGTYESVLSNSVGFVVDVQPTAPTMNVSTLGSSAFDLTWPPVLGAATYAIERTTNYVDYQIVGSASDVNYTDSSISIGVPYAYRYRPFDASGIEMSLSATSGLNSAGVQPLTPSQLQARALTSTSVQLDWTQVPSVMAYNVYRSSTAGGPYSLIGTTSLVTFNYTDNSVGPGGVYYYVVKAVAGWGAESGFSNEQGVDLSSAPSSLSAVNSNNIVVLNWSAVPGATSYIVRRSEISGADYGKIASGVTATTYQDLQVENGRQYYYVVDAVFPSGLVSAHSPEASIVAASTMDLQVPVELTDQALSSQSTPHLFERTRTSLNTVDYDGTVTYEFEVVATNYLAMDQAISLVDANGSVVGIVTIPGSSNEPLRLRSTWVPIANASNYRVALPGTDPASSVQLFSARLLINQVGASKTKLYFPLISSAQLPSELDETSPSVSVASTNYAELEVSSIYRRITSSLAEIDDYNAWTLETLVAADSGSSGIFGLKNMSKGTLLSGTETLFSNTAIKLVQVPIDEGISDFAAANEGEDYQIALKCWSGCGPKQVHLYKAGLWLSLSLLKKAEVHYRLALAMPPMLSAVTAVSERSLLDSSRFSNPTFLFQAIGSTVIPGSTMVTLMSAGGNDVGSTLLNPVFSADLSFMSNTKELVRSSQINLNQGDRYVSDVSPVSGSFRLNSSTLIIQARP